MNEVTSLILRRMRRPLILMVCVYSLSILGLSVIPGVDEHGNTQYMSIFHAFYFVSYTATTIGFGEIPYSFTNAQRLWTICIIYLTVTSWFYALGKIISLYQDKNFLKERKKLKFKRDIKNIDRPYYVVCGYGETGKAVVHALLDEHFGAVIIELKSDVIEQGLHDTLEYVPGLAGDASEPDILELAGVYLNKCRGVIAVTASDETNLKIAICSKLLHPDVTVICRSEYKEHEENMLSFGTDHILNPFESFSSIFRMALYSPSMHLIYDWLTGARETSLSTPINIEQGHWILCGYGRFGQQLHHDLAKRNIRTVIIDPRKEAEVPFINNRQADDTFIIGTGTDARTLSTAGIETAAGIIAGSENDSNNLSIIMTARQLNEKVFIIGRQNLMSSRLLYSKINEHYDRTINRDRENLTNIAHMMMQPSELIARKIRSILIAPLLIDFIEHALQQDPEWANITISRLSAVIGERSPQLWTVHINKDNAAAIVHALGYGRKIQIKHIIKNPEKYHETLPCVPLLLKRGDSVQLLPDENTELQAFDQLLFCGLRKIKYSMAMTLSDLSTLNNIMTYRNEPQTYLWKKMTHLLQKKDRRTSSR